MKYDKEKKKCEIWGSRVPVIHLFGGWFIGKGLLFGEATMIALNSN